MHRGHVTQTLAGSDWSASRTSLPFNPSLPAVLRALSSVISVPSVVRSLAAAAPAQPHPGAEAHGGGSHERATCAGNKKRPGA